MVWACSEDSSGWVGGMKHIRAANWVAETAESTSGGFNLLGSTKGYSSFKNAFSKAQDIWYAAHDEHGNREAGHAYFTGSRIKNRVPTATLNNGVYNNVAPHQVEFKGQVTIACTFNSAAFNLLWESLQALDPDGDGNINIPPELIDGLVDGLRNKADQVDLDAEVRARIAGDKSLQDQIDGLNAQDNDPVSWESVLEKPESISALGYKNEINGGSY
jgi:hypothetical protein